MSRLFDLRRLLVIAALISLCVSKNVGPQFLPLPNVIDPAAENLRQNERDNASRHPSPSKSDSFRVPMLGHGQKRSDNQLTYQPVIATLNVSLAFATFIQTAVELIYPNAFLASSLVSQPPGRSPPYSV